MLLTVTTTRSPATDLGFLLHKHPDRVHKAGLAYGDATVFYPEATEDRCTAALLLDVDPIRLMRGRGPSGDDAFSLAQYVNDRPYAASSLLSVAIGRVFRTAMAGRCAARPDLENQRWPWEIALPAVRGTPDLVERLFAPLGWTVETEPIADWGPSRYVGLRLTGTALLADALTQVYVLLPVLDNAKHYWVSADEVEKLLTAAGAWLPTHPERELIVRRYLRHRGELTRTTLARLAESDDIASEAVDDAVVEAPQEREPLRLIRRNAVVRTVRELGGGRVVDLGCGDGVLVADLCAEPTVREVLGVDVSVRALSQARRRVDRLADRMRSKADLTQGALTYSDDRLAGYDVAVLMEVIEHIDPQRLPAAERAVFGTARPTSVVVTTPNAEYNVRYTNLTGYRHHDHRFEWTRDEFAEWSRRMAAQYGYQVRIEPVGPDDPEVGPSTQMAVFTR